MGYSVPQVSSEVFQHFCRESIQYAVQEICKDDEWIRNSFIDDQESLRAVEEWLQVTRILNKARIAANIPYIHSRAQLATPNVSV